MKQGKARRAGPARRPGRALRGCGACPQRLSAILRGGELRLAPPPVRRPHFVQRPGMEQAQPAARTAWVGLAWPAVRVAAPMEAEAQWVRRQTQPAARTVGVGLAWPAVRAEAQ
jgi:hypothetical protein